MRCDTIERVGEVLRVHIYFSSNSQSIPHDTNPPNSTLLQVPESPSTERTTPSDKGLDELKELKEYEQWESTTFNFGYRDTAILTVMKAPYLDICVAIRDLIGEHTWMINERRVVVFF